MTSYLYHRARSGDQRRILLVMLPGAGIAASDFVARGFVASVHERSLPVDVVAAHLELDFYLEDAVASEIHRGIIEPAQKTGYTRIWFLAISLGGMAALLYASSKMANVEGMVLLAPFLGTRGTIAELARSGGLAAWSASGSMATPAERRLLLWLKEFLSKPQASPALYLGYGLSDRFAQGHAMLADLLPRDRVVTADGGHDWETWAKLWRDVLDAEPFTKNGGPGFRA